MIRRLLLPVVLVCVVPSTYAFDVGYSHTYEDYSKKNYDQINLSHAFKNNVTTTFEMRGKSEEYANGKQGKALSNVDLVETHYKVKYKYRYSDRLTISPDMGWDHYHKKETERYKVRVGFSYNLTPEWQIYNKYRYDYFTNKHASNFDYYTIELGLNQNVGNWGLTYGYDQYYTSRNYMYDNQYVDYKVKFAAEYKLTPNFKPYFEIRNECYKNYLSQRQTNVEVGFNYKFF